MSRPPRSPRIVPRPKSWDEQFEAETPQERRARRRRALIFLALIVLVLVCACAHFTNFGGL